MEGISKNAIWVFVQQRDSHIESITFELLAKAQELKAHSGEPVCAVLMGFGVSALAPELIASGADEVLIAEHEALASYSARPFQQALAQLARRFEPSVILYGATSVGRDLAPRVMVSLGTGLTADAIDLGYDEDGMLYQTTPAYGGSILAHIVIPERRPQMATVREGIAQPLEPDRSRRGVAESVPVEVEPDAGFELLSREPKAACGAPISEAEIIVSGGRGVKSEEEFKLLEELASLLGGQTACSRPLVDSGMLPHSKQIGQSGTTVKPKLIINVGISGSVQYRIGMQGSKLVVSINHTKNAPIFDISNYGINADLKSVLPAIIAEVKKRKQETV